MSLHLSEAAADEAVAAMLERARRSEKSAPRKHHLVPASYLERWEVRGKIRVTETDSPLTYTPSADTAARETDFYSLKCEDLDANTVPPLLMETLLSTIEGGAKPAIDRLVQAERAELGPDDAVALSMFLAFQTTRGRAFRAALNEVTNAGLLLMWDGITDEGIAQRLRQRGQPDDAGEVARTRRFLDEWRAGKYTAGPQPAAQVGHAAEAACPLMPYFLARSWVVYRSRLPLITCDEPVAPVSGPRADPRCEPGLATAGAILFPLDPHHLLAMFHPELDLERSGLEPDLTPVEADEVNLFVAAHSDRWLFEQGDRTRTTTLWVPPLPAKRAVFETVASRTNPASGYRSDLIRGSGETRWSRALSVPPPPVARWWARAWEPGLHDLPHEPVEMPFPLVPSGP